MTESQLMDRRVVSQDGYVLGDVSSIVIDTGTWRVVELAVRLRRKALEPLRLKKPLLGTQTIAVPADEIAGVSDTLVLRHKVGEFRFLPPELSQDQAGKEAASRERAPGVAPPEATVDSKKEDDFADGAG